MIERSACLLGVNSCLYSVLAGVFLLVNSQLPSVSVASKFIF